MSSNQDPRTHIVRLLKGLGASADRYEELLATTPPNKVIEGLDPWFFPPAPGQAIGFCSEAVGRPVLPFAQAIGEDMMACFEAEPGKAPAVVVINPWAENKADVILAELPDFAAWMAYAEKVSKAVQAREREDADDE